MNSNDESDVLDAKKRKYWEIRNILSKRKEGQVKEGIIFKENVWTIREIEEELRKKGVKDIVWQGIEKELQKLLRTYEVMLLEKTPRNKMIVKDCFNSRYDSRVKGYYIYTPRSHQVY